MTTWHRWGNVAGVFVPLAGFVAAIVLLWGEAVGIRDLAIMLALYLLTGFGITVGFHRLLTHRSFETGPAVRATFAVLGSMAVQGPVINWVADHRKHHAFTDEEGDPHSPHTHSGEGVRGVLTGLWHSHVGWLFDGQRTSASRYAPDLKKDPVIRLVDKLFPLWVLLGLAIPFLAGFALSGGSLYAGFTAFLWAGLVRVFLLHHATWSVNSICHMYGRRPFATGDESRDNWLVALVSFGEGWHHSHHAFPTSARHGLRRTQVDPSYAVIRALERVGLVWNVKRPRAEQIAAKRRVPAPLAPADRQAA